MGLLKSLLGRKTQRIKDENTILHKLFKDINGREPGWQIYDKYKAAMQILKGKQEIDDDWVSIAESSRKNYKG